MILIAFYASFSLCAHPEPCHPPATPSVLQRPARKTCQPGHGTNRNKPRTPCARERSALPLSHSCPPSLFSPGRTPGCPSAVASLASSSPGLPLPQCCRCALESGDGAWHLPRHLQPCNPVPMPRGMPRSLGTHLLSRADTGSLAQIGRASVAVLGGCVPALETRGGDAEELQPCPAHP